MSGSIGESPKPGQELSPEGIAVAEAALNLFIREHWGGSIPVLDGPAQVAVKAYLEGKGMIASANIWPFPIEPNQFRHEDSPRFPMLGTVLGLDGHIPAELENFRDAVVGPYFLGEEYIPEGASVWRSEEGLKTKR